MTGPNLWFSLAVAGLLLLYWELFRPGLVVPAAAGIFLLILGMYHLAFPSPSALGIVLLSSAGFMFLSELVIDTRFLSGIAGTAALAAGALRLHSGSPRLHPALAAFGALLIGTTTTGLTIRARTARTNKRNDL